MNLLLLQEADCKGSFASISGRRAFHVATVLKKKPGDSLVCGVENVGRCEAAILALSETFVDLELGTVTPTSPPLVHLVLAVPRPKAISRIVQAAASFGVQSITFINAWRVEKSYFTSPRLLEQRLRDDAILGAEQGRHVWVPRFFINRSFRHYIEDECPVRYENRAVERVALHPDAPNTMHSTLHNALPHVPQDGRPPCEIILALGPEGGFIQSELESLQRARFELVRLQTGPLKTEVALAAALGQMALLSPALFGT